MKKILLLLWVVTIPLMQIQAQQRMWGVKYRGGNINGTGNGTNGTLFVYNLDNPAITSTVYNFTGGSGGSGTNPTGSPAIFSNGHVYGTTESGGANNYGTIWKYDIANSTMSAFHHFNGTTGRYAHGNLIEASNGKGYGVTSQAGSNNQGTLFEFNPAGSGVVVKHNFAAATGHDPIGGLLEVSPGILLGVTYNGGTNNLGVLFEYNLNTSTYTVKQHLDAATGSKPFAALIKAPNGKLYGTTSAGGTNGLGTIFEYDYATNTFTVKQNMSNSIGESPKGSLLIASDGLMYGLAETGGTGTKGTLFQYDYIHNTIAVKVEFDGAAKGANPNASLVENNGRLYGLTQNGGASNTGVIFQYDYVSNTFTKNFEWGSYVYGQGFPFMVTFAIENCPGTTITTHPSSTTVCSSGNTTFTAAATSSSTIAYKWQVKSGAGIFSDISDDATYANSSTAKLSVNSGTGLNGNYYRCKITSGSCNTYTNPAVLTVTTDPVVTPALSIAVTSGSASGCTGNAVTFTATATHGGSSPSYQWKVNNVNVGTGATFTSGSLSDNDSVHCVLTSNAACATSTTATSAAIYMHLTTTVTPQVSIAITSGANGSCAGSTHEFTATAVHGGSAPGYQWLVNGSAAGTGSVFTSNSLQQNDEVKCVLTSDLACVTSSTATSNAIAMNVSALETPTVSISITFGNATMCEGSTTTFKAVSTFGGSAPVYQWNVNGVAVASGETFTTNTLEDADEIICVLTSNYACVQTSTASSNSINVDVTEAFTAVAYADGSLSTDLCAGEYVTLSATDVTGASYAWTGPGGFTAATRMVNVSDAEEGDYTVTITKGACSSDAIASVEVHALPSAPSITPDFINNTLSSSEVSGNQWYLDGAAISGATNQTLNLVEAGSYTVTFNNGMCTSEHSTAYVHFTTALKKNTLSEKIQVYPNPSGGLIHVSLADNSNSAMISISDVYGNEVYSGNLNQDQQLDMSGLNIGMYFVRVMRDGEEGKVKLVLE